MSDKNTSTKLLFDYSYLYVKKMTVIFNYILTPILTFLGYLSPTIKKSLENTLSPVIKFIITLPIFISILALSAFIFGEFNNLETIFIQIDLIKIISIHQFLIVIIALLGPITFFTSRKRNKSIKTSLIYGVFVTLAVIPLAYLTPPNLYVYMITILFAVGAYSTTHIKFKNYVPIQLILDEEKPHTVGIGYAFFYAVAFMPMVYAINTQYFTENVTFGLTILLGIVAYGVTYLYEDLYRDVYESLRLNKSSRFFLYPARIAVVYASGIVIIHQSVSTMIMVLYAVPIITFMSFYSYITSGNDNKYSKRKQVAEENMYNSMGVNLIYDSEKPSVDELECDLNRLDDIGDTACIEFSMKVEIPENDTKGSWEKFMNTTDDVHRIISKLQSPEDNINKEEFNKFYDEIAKIGYDKIIDHETSEDKKTHNIDDLDDVKPRVDEWPRELLSRIQEQMYKFENADMDDIVEFEKHIDNKNKNISDVESYIQT